MKAARNVAVLVGSLRRGSLTRKLARAVIAMAPLSLEAEIVEIGQLSLYNEDDEESPPPTWLAFRDRIRAAQAILIATPEYNRSIPGVLKNALDVGSRPYGKSVWSGKPAAIVSVSPGAMGGFGANHHLRQCLTYLDMPAMQQPEAYVGKAHEVFDHEGAIGNESTRTLLTRFMQSFAEWIDRLEAQP